MSVRRRIRINKLAFLALVVLALIWAFQEKPEPIRTTDLIQAALRSTLAVELPAQMPSLPTSFDASPRYNTSVAHLCSLLTTKNLQLVGPETTYHLHTLLLNALEQRDGQDYTCLGPEFCTFHHVCAIKIDKPDIEYKTRGAPTSTTSSSKPRPSKYSYKDDERVKKVPSHAEMRTLQSSIIRFTLSQSLYTEKSQDEPIFDGPQVDPETGVRVKNLPWVSKSKKREMLVLHRGPVPAPAWTYAGAGGNWTFAEQLYWNASANLFVQEDVHRRSAETRIHSPRSRRNDQQADAIINAALHTTFTKYLPEVEKSLAAVRSLHRKHPTLWHGGWYMLPRCWDPRNGAQYRDIEDLLLDASDPWALYYNAQEYIHTLLLPPLLERFGIVYLPLDTPFEYRTSPSTNLDNSMSRPRNCLRYPLDSPAGSLLLDSFVRGLVQVLTEDG